MAVNFKDKAEVEEYLQRLLIEYRFGCEKERKPEVCHLLGDYFEAISKELPAAAAAYRENCDDRAYAHSCRKYAGYLFTGASGAAVDHAAGMRYLRRGCELNDGVACHRYGALLARRSPEMDAAAAVKALARGCELREPEACHLLSGMYISGVRRHDAPAMNPHSSKSKAGGGENGADYALQRDFGEAFKYAQKACELRNFFACANLAQMYARGDGTDRNPDLAAKFRKVAGEIKEEMDAARGIEFQR